MPVVEHSTVRMSEAVDYHRERTLVSSEQGAVSLTVKDVELQPGWEGRLHTHPTDIAVMVTGGAIQMEIGDEMHTVRTGFTMVAPPGVPHRLINQLWVPATMLVIYPASELETTFVE